MATSGTTQILTVQLTGVSFYDADSSFTIARAVSAENEDITMVGYLKGGIPGEVIEAKGSWRNNNKSEPRFYAETFTKTLPITNSGVLQYLNSGLIRGLDHKLAQSITGQFGAKTFDVLTYNSKQLTEIDGICDNKAALIAESWKKHLTILSLTDFLHNMAVSPVFAAPIFNKLGHNALELIKANPFILVSRIKGLNYVTAARIARQLDIDPNNMTFARYGLFNIMENLARKGHTYYPYPKLLANSIKKLGLKPGLVADAIAQCAAQGQIILKDLNGTSRNFILNNKAVYLERFYHYEKNLAAMLKRHLNASVNPKFKTLDTHAVINSIPDVKHDEIRNGLEAVFKQKCFIIDDSMKCKKSYFLTALHNMAVQTGLKITVTALSQNISHLKKSNIPPALMSVRELLDYDPDTGLYRYNARNPLDCDILVIVQASLLDTITFHDIMSALPPHAVLILTGDHNHLPPAGPGRVFYDLVASEQLPLVSLKNLDMPIDFSSKAAYRINRGEMPDLPVFKPFELKEQNFYFIEQDAPEKIFKTVGGLCAKRLPKSLGYDILDIQVVSLCKKGPVSAKKMNLFLQERLNKRTGGLKHNGFIFKINDKVVQIADNPRKGLYVGQTGIIKDINMYKKELCVEFKGKLKNTYLFHELNELRLAYAMPISKSGMRKHTAIILPLHCDSYTNLNRMMLYSVFLMAGEMLIIVGQKRALKIALDTFKAEKRYTGLKELLLT